MLHFELIPAAKKSSRLMIVMHGLGDSLAGFRWITEAMQLPWLNYLLVNAPDEYYGGYSWYDYAGDQARRCEQGRDQCALHVFPPRIIVSVSLQPVSSF